MAKDSHKRKNRLYIICANIATNEALFDVGEGVIVIEKYSVIYAQNK
jgi:hypothetical protein